MSNQVSIRPAQPDDIPFIYSVWLRSYRHDSPITRYIKQETFFKEHQRLLDRLMLRQSVKVTICCSESDPALIFGFMAYETPNIIHFIYVKKPFRGEGFAKLLIKSQGIVLEQCQTTHLTYGLLDMWKENKTSIPYNPYLLEQYVT